MLELSDHLATNGDCPFEKWFATLDTAAATKVTTASVGRISASRFAS